MFVRGRTAFAHTCCSRRDGNYAAALHHCAAGLDAVDRPGGSHDAGCSPATVWQAADLKLQLQLQQAKCQAALVRIYAICAMRMLCAYAVLFRTILTMSSTLYMQDQRTAAMASTKAVAAAHLQHPVAAAAATILAATLAAPADTSATAGLQDTTILAAQGVATLCAAVCMVQRRCALLAAASAV